jgi:hypothetical protein
MTRLLELKDQLIRFYSKYETFLYPFVKFVISFLLFMEINSDLGFMTSLSTPAVALVLGVLCALLPTRGIVWIGALLVLADMYALSLEVAVTTLVLFAALFFVYFRFVPEDGLAAVLTPLSFKLGIPYLMPGACGLLRDVYSVIAVVCGTVVYYFLDGIHQNAGILMNTAAEGEEELSKFDITAGQLLGNKEMYLVIVIFAITALVVYAVRRMRVDHAWTLAIISGALIEFVGLFAGYLVLNIDISDRTVRLIVGGILSVLIEIVIEFFAMNLDYARTERVQFEDDDYYYYVKAVPKKMVAVKEVTVKHFGNTGSMGKRMNRSRPQPTEEEEETSRRVMARELDIDEELLK